MKKTIQLAFSLVLALPASGQQVASLDLTRPVPAAEIPKSTDEPESAGGWQVGEFRVELKGKQHSSELKGLSQILFASTFFSGSSLTLKPREWISARINFIVEVAKPAYMGIDEGDAEVPVRWFQTTRSRVEKDCRVSLGYFPFQSYEQENPSVSVQIEKSDLEASKKADSQTKSTQRAFSYYAKHIADK